MSLAWTTSQPLQPQPRTELDPPPERLRLIVAMPIVFSVSVVLWGGIGVAVAWLMG